MSSFRSIWFCGLLALLFAGCSGSDCFPSCPDGERCAAHKCQTTGVDSVVNIRPSKGTLTCLGTGCSVAGAKKCCPANGPYYCLSQEACYANKSDALLFCESEVGACEGLVEDTGACPADHGKCSGLSYCCPCDHPYFSAGRCLATLEDADNYTRYFIGPNHPRATCACGS